MKIIFKNILDSKINEKFYNMTKIYQEKIKIQNLKDPIFCEIEINSSFKVDYTKI